MDDSIVNLIVFGVISWTTIFLLTRKLFPNRSFDFSNRLVSTLHAILAVTLSSRLELSSLSFVFQIFSQTVWFRNGSSIVGDRDFKSIFTHEGDSQRAWI